jgi:hypothetical protein
MVRSRCAFGKGERFGKLAVVREVAARGGCSVWLCECDCGAQAEVRGRYLKVGRTRSCGCMKRSGERIWRGYGEISGTYWSKVQADARPRGLSFEISIRFAWEMFLRQGRACALTGESLAFGRGPGRAKQTASLDRVDSSLGYLEGNVQWVHRAINMMKRAMPEPEFIRWCQKVVAHRTG